MAIKRGGRTPPSGPRPADDVGRTDAATNASRTDTVSDGFESTSQKHDLVAERGSARAAFARKAAILAGEDLGKLETDLGKVLAVLAGRGFEDIAFERHKKELARIRMKMNAARKTLLRDRRRQIENDSGMDEVPASQLGKVEDALEDLRRFSTDWARAFAAVGMGADLAEDGPARLEIKDANKRSAMTFAETTNVTTAIADLAASAHHLLAATPAGGETGPASGAHDLGRSLGGLRALQQLIEPTKDE